MKHKVSPHQTAIDFDAIQPVPSKDAAPEPVQTVAKAMPSNPFVWKVRGEKYCYKPADTKPFKLSRSKLEQFMRCPRCFYLDRRHGVGQPKGPSFTLNTAVDTLLKKEFDVHRAAGSQHPLCKQYGVDAVPFDHEHIDKWRENFVGVQYFHESTNLLLFGAVDDLWVTPEGQIMVVDYKATSTEKEISLDDFWKQAYKRQMEIYQWLLRQNGFDVAATGYFVYCNGLTDRQAFDGHLEFHVQLMPHEGDDSWVENVVFQAKQCLDGTLPERSAECDFCLYSQEVAKFAPR